MSTTRWRRERLLILCYHGVSLADEHEWSDLYVSPGHLERRLQLLKQYGATILPLQEGVARLRDGTLPECAVSLTFDDGAHDFSSRAVPILTEAGAHATLYLTTYYCNRNQPVFDTIASYLLWKGRGKTVLLPGLQQTVTIPDSFRDPRFGELHLAVRRYAHERHFGADEKDVLARALATVVGMDYDAIVDSRLLQIMSHDEVRALDGRLVDVQLHTHRHRTPRNREAFLKELHDNAREIRVLRGADVRLNHFCYPSGDHAPEFAGWLAEAGVEWATVGEAGLAEQGSNPYYLPRFVDTEPVPEATFIGWVSGLSNFAHLKRRGRAVRL